jgi:hypothetical protein
MVLIKREEVKEAVQCNPCAWFVAAGSKDWRQQGRSMQLNALLLFSDNRVAALLDLDGRVRSGRKTSTGCRCRIPSIGDE